MEYPDHIRLAFRTPERECERELAGKPAAAREALLWKVIEKDAYKGFRVAVRSSGSEAFFEALFKHAVRHPLRQLGQVATRQLRRHVADGRMAELIAEMAEEDPAAVNQHMVFFVHVLARRDAAVRAALQALQRRLRAQGLEEPEFPIAPNSDPSDWSAVLHRRAEPERRRIVFQVLHRHDWIGLAVANRCLRSRADFERIFRDRLVSGSQVVEARYYHCCLPRLGGRRILRIIRECAAEHPELVRQDPFFYARYPFKRHAPRWVDAMRKLATDLSESR